MRSFPGLFIVALLGINIPVASSQYSFLTIGDWGGNDVSAKDSANVQAVSAQMVITAQQSNPQFVLNTGDNFYWCGTTSTTDAQFQKDWVTPFASQMPEIKWYSVLGNHDYAYSPQSQVDYSRVNSQWVMPSRYYTKRKLLGNGIYASFIFLDTSPCVKEYRATDQSKWDPCGTKMPTCSLSDSNDDFEGTCNMHDEVMKQSCSTQFTWFKAKLAAVPVSDWLIVVGHHPIDEVNVADFTSALRKRGFSIYFNGHTHTLTQYTVKGSGAYVTSGAGSMVASADQTTAASLRKLVETEPEEALNQLWIDRALSYWRPYHSYRGARYSRTSVTGVAQVWNQKVAGFTLSTFSADFQSLTTQFISTSGSVVHSFTSTRAGKIKSAATFSPAYNRFLEIHDKVQSTLRGLIGAASGVEIPDEFLA